MPNNLVPRKPQPMEQVERADERMRDTSEFDNLEADVRMSHGKELTMPWKTGRALRSAGVNALGEPITPLAALDLNALVTAGEKAALSRELDRVVMHDAISEGVLDMAERQGVPLLSEEQWWEADNQTAEDEAIAKGLVNNPLTSTKDARLHCAICDEVLSSEGNCSNHSCVRYKAGHPSNSVSGNQL
jgi:hypothetical protein